MSYIQCKSEEECEAALWGRKTGFVTEDFRIYDEIEIWDDALMYHFNAETAMQLYSLQLDLERLCEDLSSEMSFVSVDRYAKELKSAFEETLRLINFKPLKRVQK